jgi:hypothetical protein
MKTIGYIFIMFVMGLLTTMYYLKMVTLPALNHADLDLIYVIIGASAIISIFIVAFHFIMKA